MAELQLALKYEPAYWRPFQVLEHVSKWAFVVVLPSLFLWFMLGFLLLPAFAAMRFTSVQIVPWAVGFSYVLIVYLLIGITNPIRNRRLEVSQSGMVLPLLEAAGNGFRSAVLWSDVKSATVVSDDTGTNGTLLFLLDSGKQLRLQTAGFRADALEQLLLAVELWGVNTIRSPELIDFQTRIHNLSKGVKQTSYTEMWEEELSRRFSATSFIPLEPGQTLKKDELKVVRQLAFGGFSALYLVHESDSKLAVIKEAVVPQYADEKARREAEKCLAREARILTGLQHPNLVKVKDYFVEQGRNYLLLDYVAGQDLRQLVRQTGPQSAERVVEWTLQIADALEYLHTLNPAIIHRDLTPDNIVLNIDGSVILIDFGSANEFVGTATGTIIGKQAYMAPEQLRGKAACQSDIYALGATMFFLLTGRDPVPLSASRASLIMPEITPELDNVVLRATAYEVSDRIQSAGQIKEMLLDG